MSLARSKPIGRKAPIKGGGPLRKVGKKGRASARANRLLKKECRRLGIDRCECGFAGCFGDDYLSFAHVAKRRELLPGELETAAIVACFACHRILDEEMSHAEMRTFIEKKLAERKTRMPEAA